MALALSAELRRRVVAAVEDGMSCRAAAACVGITPSTAIRWLQQWRRMGSVEPQARGSDRRSHRLEAHGAEVLALISATPNITLAEIGVHPQQKHGLDGCTQHGLAAARSPRAKLQKKTAHSAE